MFWLSCCSQENLGKRGSMNSYKYASEPNLSTEEFIDVLNRSTLGQRRPTDDKERMGKMLKNVSIIITCRTSQGELVGVSRAMTDYSFSTYLADLAVDEKYQRQGIGKELIERTHKEAGLETTLILIAAPKARTYYGHIGMEQHPSCWIKNAAPEFNTINLSL